MAENKKIEIRSEQVSEILGSPPKSIIRWGITGDRRILWGEAKINFKKQEQNK